MTGPTRRVRRPATPAPTSTRDNPAPLAPQRIPVTPATLAALDASIVDAKPVGELPLPQVSTATHLPTPPVAIPNARIPVTPETLAVLDAQVAQVAPPDAPVPEEIVQQILTSPDFQQMVQAANVDAAQAQAAPVEHIAAEMSTDGDYIELTPGEAYLVERIDMLSAAVSVVGQQQQWTTDKLAAFFQQFESMGPANMLKMLAGAAMGPKPRGGQRG